MSTTQDIDDLVHEVAKCCASVTTGKKSVALLRSKSFRLLSEIMEAEVQYSSAAIQEGIERSAVVLKKVLERLQKWSGTNVAAQLSRGNQMELECEQCHQDLDNALRLILEAALRPASPLNGNGSPEIQHPIIPAGEGKSKQIDLTHEAGKAVPTQSMQDGQKTTIPDNLLDTLANILSTPEKREVLQGLKGGDAQSLIDFLYLLLSRPLHTTKPWLRKHILMALRKISEYSMLYPHWYVLEGVECESHEDGGGFCDVHKGRHGNLKLCLKVVKVYLDKPMDGMLKLYAKEAILWGQLRHPNIVPFYGIFYLGRARDRICLVSPWMNNGNIVAYLKDNPEVPRKPFILDIAKGLNYLHDESVGVVHGDLKGLNILVSDSGRAMITDFGISVIRSDKTLGFTNQTSRESIYSVRWTAPELLEDDARPSRAGDVWAFGCVCYEILSRRVPFHACSTPYQILAKLYRRRLPAHPEGDLGTDPVDKVDEGMWILLNQCWSIDAEERPTSQQILQKLECMGLVGQRNDETSDRVACEVEHFRSIMGNNPDVTIDLVHVQRILEKIHTGGSFPDIKPSITEIHDSPILLNDRLKAVLSHVLGDPLKRQALLGLKNDRAQLMLDFLYLVILQPGSISSRLRKNTIIALYRLSAASDLYPRCCILKDINPVGLPVDVGAFSDIYRSHHGDQNLCLKVPRIYQKWNKDTFSMIFAKEAILWSQLRHPNILPFYGICFLGESHRRVCLVSPWMENSNLASFLERNPSMPRKPFIYDVISGLEYLHGEDIIHGALKGNDILVNNIGRACIADFGVSTVAVDDVLSGGITSVALRFAAPELLVEGARPSKASDIWALGSICYQIITRLVPYHEYANDTAVIIQLIRCRLPTRPGGSPVEELDRIDDEMWELMERCWASEPKDRPTVQQIARELEPKGLGMRQKEVRTYALHEDGISGFRNAMRRHSDTNIDLVAVGQVLNDL